MRLYKSATEVKVMREAAAISARAHVRAMQACRAGLHEYSLEAELEEIGSGELHRRLGVLDPAAAASITT